jgi:hypothetical protein
MLDTLISSKTRVKLLLKFFLNTRTTAYLRGLEAEFGESSNGIRLELNRFEEAGMIRSQSEGNKKVFSANTDHPLFKEINSILMKYIGFDQIIEQVVNRLGKVESVYATGELAAGRDSRIIDLIFVGDVDKNYLLELVEKAELLVNRKVRFLIYSSYDEMNEVEKHMDDLLLLWNK